MTNRNITKTEQTKYDIKCAFLQLMEEKKLEDITIREISDISGYHRSTVYLYFKNISDIMIQIEDEMLDELSENLKNEFRKNPAKDIDGFVSNVVTAFRKRTAFYPTHPLSVLLGTNGDMNFYTTVKENIKNRLTEIVSDNEIADDYEKEYFVEFLSSGIVSVIRHWFETGMNIPPEILVGYLAKNIACMFSGL